MESKKFLIAGLGNIGGQYEHTRHNIGFDVLDEWASNAGVNFSLGRHAQVATLQEKGRQITLIKPTTYMNLSGKAVKYWMQELQIPIENILVIIDDLALPFGKLRLRGNGSAGGHNGLKSIDEVLGSQQYARLRFGIGNDYPKGFQVDYVLGKWNKEQADALPERMGVAVDISKSFCLAGLALTMTQYNNK